MTKLPNPMTDADSDRDLLLVPDEEELDEEGGTPSFPVATRLTATAPPEAGGLRLDKFLAAVRRGRERLQGRGEGGDELQP